MLKGAVSRRYARALFDIATAKGIVDQLEAEISGIVEVFNTNEELPSLLHHPRITDAEKIALAEEVFQGKVSDEALNFVRLLLARHRIVFLEDILAEYTELANETRNMVQAQVTTAVPMEENEQQQIKEKLVKMTGKQVQLSAKVDSSIIGGVVVRLGDTVIDGSVARQLAVLKDKLKQVQV